VYVVVYLTLSLTLYLMKPRVPRLLIVGAGITGSVASALLRTVPASQLSVTVFEKCHGAGGRFSDSRSNVDSRIHFDLGAQYITVGAGGGNVFDSRSPFHYDALGEVVLFSL
jgi:phytoene dehydrogenase-like protein